MIFKLFKSKPILKEIIPKGFIDIHSHILPEIDDGAKNIAESIKLIEEMERMGFNKIIATPHTYPGLYDNTNLTIEKSFHNLISAYKGDVIINYSSEYMIDDLIISSIYKNSLIPIKNKYILIEIPFLFEPPNLYKIIFELQTNGFTPILAHPERYRFWHNDLSKFEELKKIGCKLQLNLLSAVGIYGKNITKFTDVLLEKNFIDFVGSDIHNLIHCKFFDKKLKIKNIDKLKSAIQNNNYFE